MIKLFKYLIQNIEYFDRNMVKFLKYFVQNLNENTNQNFKGFGQVQGFDQNLRYFVDHI